MELFSSKSQSGGKHYLITTKYKIWEIGSVFRIMGNIIYDCDTKAYEIFYESIPSSWIPISESESKSLLTSPRNDRINLLNNTKKKNSRVDLTSMIQNDDNVANYLLSGGYLSWPSGSIFEVIGDKFTDSDKKNGGNLDYGIPSSWIQINSEEKRFLLTKKKLERVSIYASRLNTETTTNVSGPVSLPNSFPRNITTKEFLSASSISEPIQSDTKVMNKYFELTLIQPLSVSDIKATDFDEWCIGENVWFRLAESYTKYDGVLKWTGIVNNIKSAVVELDLVKANDPILSCRCTLDLCSKFSIRVFKPSYIVVLSCLQICSSKHAVMEKYFSKMFASISDSEMSVEIFNDCLRLNNMKFTKSLIENSPQDLLMDLCMKLMSSSISDENTDIVQDMVNKMVKDVDILKLAKAGLIMKNIDFFKHLMAKCNNANSLLDSGETFLTDLLKSKVAEKLINTVLNLKLFDVNKANNKNETPLILACGETLKTTVRILVDQNCNIDYDNYRAMDVLFSMKKTAVKLEQLKKVLDIIEILNKKPKAVAKEETNICSICMDRKINIVFNCGHTCCKECADRMTVCPMCSGTIASKIVIFLD